MTDEQIHEVALAATKTYYMRSGKVHFDAPDKFIDEFSSVYSLAVETITNKISSEETTEMVCENSVKENEAPKKYIISSSNSIRGFLA